MEARKNDRAELVTIHHNICVHVHRLQGPTVHTHTQILQTSERFLLPSCYKHFKPTIKL